jgi:Fe-S-cluster-containing dehydrogenase component
LTVRKPIKDGDVLTACQQTCPAEAISFGNINDPESVVSKMKKNNRNYTLLHELNIKPRTTYLAKVRNPNPELA